ncbi:MAG: hypothetical protein U9N53_03470, partial [Bacteroidota bacterium]|nr:hypothetical protein [Bacteroidota bacterium]
MRYIIILFFLLFSLFTNAQGIDDDKDMKVDTIGIISVNYEEGRNLFDSDGLLRVSLSFDIRQFKKGKRDPEYQDAVLKIYFPDSPVVEKNIQLKPRGIRRLEHCHFPPIKLNFKKIAFEDEYLDQQSTMKFVTHCKTSKYYESFILKEYLIYKMYNLLTDYSFRVRLVEMEYIDIARDKKVLVKYGFFIEHLNFLSVRNNANAIKNDRYSRRMMDRKMMSRMALFEFMIGNTDWSVTGQHNIKLLKLNDLSMPSPYPVPYDFDYSGMVDTDYSVPAESFNIESVRDRVYRGVCLGNYFVLEEIEYFKEKKQEFFDLINDFPYMEKGDKREMISYLDSFYSIIEYEE